MIDVNHLWSEELADIASFSSKESSRLEVMMDYKQPVVVEVRYHHVTLKR